MNVNGEGNRHGHAIEPEYRKRRKNPKSWLIWIGIMGANFVIQISRIEPTGPWMAFVLSCVLLVVAAYARLVLFIRRGCTLVGPDGITARGAVFERKQFWHDIYDIRVEPAARGGGPWAPQWITYLYGMDGRRFHLPYIDDRQLETTFHSEVEAIRTAGADCRGMPWDRRPEVEARIRRRAGHRKAWERAWIGALVVFSCMFVLFLALLFTTQVRPEPQLLLWIPLASFVVLAALLNWRWESQVPRSLREDP
ncbi:hypothetical protein ACWD4J_28680 [Streptomyces sp. NPDC002577]